MECLWIERPNDRLSRAVKDAKTYFGPTPFIGQREVYDRFAVNFLTTTVMDFPVCERLQANTILRTDVTTKDVFDEAMSLMNKYEFDMQKVLYVAHPAHVFRVMEMGRRLYGLDGEPFIESDFVYSSKDGQKFARSAGKFAVREVMARVHHKLHGWI